MEERVKQAFRLKVVQIMIRLHRLRNWFLFCWGFYAKSTVSQLFKSDSSQIHVSWTISDQCLISPLSRHWRASCSAIPINLSSKGEKPLLPVLKTLVCCGRGLNP